MKTKVLLLVALLVGFAASALAASTLVGSKHDLSITTAGSVRVTGTNQACVFCHTPHNAIVNKLLWNRKNSLVGADFAVYTSYNRSVHRAGAPTTLTDKSNSLLCLSCHALATSAELATYTVPSVSLVADGVATPRWAATTGNMKDLTGDHPVGLNYVSTALLDGVNVSLYAPTGTTHVGAATKVRLFSGTTVGAGSMECASCHNVHDNTYGKFLVMSNSGSALCIVCHVK